MVVVHITTLVYLYYTIPIQMEYFNIPVLNSMYNH